MQRKKEVRRFAEHFEKNIQRMRQNIIDGTISVGAYHYFTIHDSKERVICAAAFEEKVLQHAIMNVCHDYFDRTLISTTYATRKGKGVYAALDKAVEAMSHYEYTVKMDVRKYYDSIDHKVLKMKLRRVFKDARLLELFDRIIDSYCVAEGKGLPKGNLTSQYFANFYLSELDHKVKEEWKTPVYVRYMDDVLMAGNDRTALVQCKKQMTVFAAETLKLTFKPPIFRRAKDGQVFLGYRIMSHYMTISGRSKKRLRSKLLSKGNWSENEYEEHILPLMAFAQHAESKAFRRECLRIS